MGLFHFIYRVYPLYTWPSIEIIDNPKGFQVITGLFSIFPMESLQILLSFVVTQLVAYSICQLLLHTLIVWLISFLLCLKDLTNILLAMHLNIEKTEAWYQIKFYIDGLMQERYNSMANVLVLRLSCTKPSIWYMIISDIDSKTEIFYRHKGTLSRHIFDWFWCYGLSLMSSRGHLYEYEYFISTWLPAIDGMMAIQCYLSWN